MGGFVAADTLFLALNEQANNPNTNDFLFPLIQGILAFDTPYNGLARSMFVYGAFSNYSKVQGVFNAMTALSAAAPATLRQLGTRSATTAAVPSAPRSYGPQWTAWQLIAVRTGTVGAIAAGGVLAYQHRETIKSGLQSVRNMNRESLAKGYRSSIDALGQGLAYINRGNVGKSFAWLSDHFTFVGALLKQKELTRRLERLGALKGVGIHDTFISLGENGYWSGGYFVPERTFCAVPESDHPTHGFFTRRVMLDADDEIRAHMNLFKQSQNAGYEDMVEESSHLVEKWFLSEDPVEDDPKFQETDEAEKEEGQEIEKVLSQSSDEPSSTRQPAEEASEKAEAEVEGRSEDKTSDLPDESPIDIAAAATLVPLPGSDGDLLADASTDDVDEAEGGQNAKRTYVQHLFGIAQAAGSEAKGWWPNKVPSMPQVQMPSMPKMPDAVSTLSMNPFSASKRQKKEDEAPGDPQPGDKENPIAVDPEKEDGGSK